MRRRRDRRSRRTVARGSCAPLCVVVAQPARVVAGVRRPRKAADTHRTKTRRPPTSPLSSAARVPAVRRRGATPRPRAATTAGASRAPASGTKNHSLPTCAGGARRTGSSRRRARRRLPTRRVAAASGVVPREARRRCQRIRPRGRPGRRPATATGWRWRGGPGSGTSPYATRPPETAIAASTRRRTAAPPGVARPQRSAGADLTQRTGTAEREAPACRRASDLAELGSASPLAHASCSGGRPRPARASRRSAAPSTPASRRAHRSPRAADGSAPSDQEDQHRTTKRPPTSHPPSCSASEPVAPVGGARRVLASGVLEARTHRRYRGARGGRPGGGSLCASESSSCLSTANLTTGPVRGIRRSARPSRPSW